MVDVAAIFKAYDVRGVVPDQLDESVARATGAAFVEVLDVLASAGAVVIGYDMRPSSPALAAAFAEGVTSTGADVIDIGLASTDQLYFASGRLQLPGAMFTASHNPAQYNGIKMCRAGASPVGSESGLRDIADLVAKSLTETPMSVPVPGKVVRKNLLTAYADHLNDLVSLSKIRPLKVVVDAGNGMGGHTVPAVFATGPVEIIPLYFELDGSFPTHEANPLDPKNMVDLQAKVREVGADLGLAFDGDADRCFVVDEKGDAISPSAITGAVAVRELAKHPGSAVI
ncbi:MAG TPA: phosphomannomutase/phosphoglucomutase, partial [Kribbella sp.]|nr:phosphomannomutase/phosphoglucomutase [Kribbella sp.]